LPVFDNKKRELMNQTVEVSRGTVVGIGKVKIPRTRELDREIQLLSFLYIKESDTSFITTCIHLRIDGYGKTLEEAERDMVQSIYYFLCQNFKELSPEDAWDNLYDYYKADEWSNELWNAYHKVQILLSMCGGFIRKNDSTLNHLINHEFIDRTILKSV
jgi:hypothetical protein